MKATTNNTGTVRQLAVKASNSYLTKAHTSTLNKLLKTFNWHFNTNIERSREELIQLVKVQRNRIVWGQYATV